MESRRLQRENSTLSIWPSSPRAPFKSSSSPDPKRRKKSRKHRHDSSDESSTDSEAEKRRRERKEKKKARKEKDREREKEKDGRRRRSRSRSARRYDDEEDRKDVRKAQKSKNGDSGDERDERHRRSTTPPTKSPEQRPPSSEVDMDEDEWVEAPASSHLIAPTGPSTAPSGSMAPPPVPSAAITSSTSKSAPTANDDSDDEVGPQPLHKATSSKRIDERQYGGALLRGEGSAMAAFLVDGTDVRIPRRGEIGLSSDEIAQFEDVGYVMSGSRHRRMNAVRMRKENQVISAEEKRGILKLQQEERERREAILREEFQALVEERLKAQGVAKPAPS